MSLRNHTVLPSAYIQNSTVKQDAKTPVQRDNRLAKEPRTARSQREQAQAKRAQHPEHGRQELSSTDWHMTST